MKEVVTKWYYCDCLLAINWDARAKTWHESTNFSSCANFSFSFRFYSTSIERDYNTHTHTHTICSRHFANLSMYMGAIMYPHTSCYRIFFLWFRLISWRPNLCNDHKSCCYTLCAIEFSLIVYILNICSSGINYANF